MGGRIHASSSGCSKPPPSARACKCDEKDGEIGFIGYEINFNRYFYRYSPPRPLEEIEADIRGIEKDIVRMLAEITGTRPEEVVK